MNNAFEETKKALREQAEARLSGLEPNVENLSPAQIKALVHEYQVHQIELELQNEELRRTQKQLEIARDEYAELFNNAPVGYLILDQGGIIAQTNQTFALMVGEKAHDLPGKPLTDFIIPEDRPAFLGRFKAFFKNPTGKQLDFRLRGNARELSVRCVGRVGNETLLQHSQDARPRLLLIINDISEQVRMEQELRDSEAKYRRLINNLPDIVYTFSDLRGGTYWSPGVEKVLGYSLERLHADPYLWNKAIHPEDKPLVEQAIRDATRDKKFSIEYRIRDAHGSWRWLHDRSIDLYTSGGETFIEGLASDITERKMAGNRLMTVLNSMDAFVHVTDMESYDVLFINDYGRRVWGDIVGQKCWRTIQSGQDGPCPFCSNDKLLDKEGHPTGVYAWEFQNTRTGRWYDCRDRAIQWTDGRMVRMEIATDITERKEAEARAALITKQLETALSEKNRFFSIIAHDLKSPMSGLLGLSKIFSESAENLTMKELQNVADAMRKSSERLYALMENLLHWALMQQGMMKYAPREYSLRELIQNSVDSLGSLAEQKQIALHIRVPEKLGVWVDPPMITTVLRNLLSNALKFTDSGGTVTASAAADGDMIKISVVDTGTGMDQDTLNHLFAIDRRTTNTGTQGEQGTGLGLILCKEFIEKHGGRVWVESELGRGAAFHFTVPALALSGKE